MKQRHRSARDGSITSGHMLQGVRGRTGPLGLGNLLNPIYPLLPLGTLTANMVDGFIIGFTMSFFHGQFAAGMAFAGHHRLSRRSHYLFHIFSRGGDAFTAPAVRRGRHHCHSPCCGVAHYDNFGHGVLFCNSALYIGKVIKIGMAQIGEPLC